MNALRTKDLVLSDRVLSLRANFASLAAAERALNRPLLGVLRDLAEGQVSVQDASVIFAGILKANNITDVRPDRLNDELVLMGFGNALVWLGQFLTMGLRSSDDIPEDSSSGEAPRTTT